MSRKRRRLFQFLLSLAFVASLANLFIYYSHKNVKLTTNVDLGDAFFATKDDIEGLRDMTGRSQTIKRICKSDGLKILQNTAKYLNTKPDYKLVERRFFTSQTYFPTSQLFNYSWCVIPKAASSTLISTIARNMGLGDIDSNNEFFSQVPHLNIKNRKNINKLVRFMNVRHPFSRLVSAYRDKFHLRSLDYKNAYAPLILEKYPRKRPIAKDNRYHNTPTFEEFVKYLVSTPTLHQNIHFIPMHLMCLPCLYDFHFILKTETMDRDISLLSKLLKFDLKGNRKNRAPSLYQEERVFLRRHLHRDPRDALEQFYFSNLTKLQFQSLVNMFDLDFKLYNYTIQPYDSYVQEK